MKNNRRLPAEWEKQQGILLCFPSNGNDWPGKYQAVQFVFVDFIKKIAEHETVFLLVGRESIKEKVIALLEAAHANRSKITFKKQTEAGCVILDQLLLKIMVSGRRWISILTVGQNMGISG